LVLRPTAAFSLPGGNTVRSVLVESIHIVLLSAPGGLSMAYTA
jgi:hypothetical protein